MEGTSTLQFAARRVPNKILAKSTPQVSQNRSVSTTTLHPSLPCAHNMINSLEYYYSSVSHVIMNNA